MDQTIVAVMTVTAATYDRVAPIGSLVDLLAYSEDKLLEMEQELGREPELPIDVDVDLGPGRGKANIRITNAAA